MAVAAKLFKKKKIKTGARRRLSFNTIISSLFLIAGIFSLISSIVFSSQIAAFLGLGLTLWGTLFLYIRTQEYVPKSLFAPSLIPSLSTTHQLLEKIGFEGTPMYLPPQYFEHTENIKIYIPKMKTTNFPYIEDLTKIENGMIHFTSNGVLLTPIGADLVKLFEKELKNDFKRIELEFLYQVLPKLLVQDLELTEEIKIEASNNQIKISLTNPVFGDLHSQDSPHSSTMSLIGCPLCSAIACAITKTAKKPVIIQKIQQSEDNKMVSLTYQLLEKDETENLLKEVSYEKLTTDLAIPTVANVRQSLLPNLTILFLTLLGSALLIPVALVVYFDAITWGKPILQILMESRTGEDVGLGIGMNLIHYLIIGLSSLLSGLLVFFRKRRKF